MHISFEVHRSLGGNKPQLWRIISWRPSTNPIKKGKLCDAGMLCTILWIENVYKYKLQTKYPSLSFNL
jgi:hypothetical protein